MIGELVVNHANTHLRENASPYMAEHFKPWIDQEERPPQKIGRSDAEIKASYARIGL